MSEANGFFTTSGQVCVPEPQFDELGNYIGDVEVCDFEEETGETFRRCLLCDDLRDGIIIRRKFGAGVATGCQFEPFLPDCPATEDGWPIWYTERTDVWTKVGADFEAPEPTCTVAFLGDPRQAPTSTREFRTVDNVCTMTGGESIGEPDPDDGPNDRYVATSTLSGLESRAARLARAVQAAEGNLSEYPWQPVSFTGMNGAVLGYSRHGFADNRFAYIDKEVRVSWYPTQVPRKLIVREVSYGNLDPYDSELNGPSYPYFNGSISQVVRPPAANDRGPRIQRLIIITDREEIPEEDRLELGIELKDPSFFAALKPDGTIDEIEVLNPGEGYSSITGHIQVEGASGPENLEVDFQQDALGRCLVATCAPGPAPSREVRIQRVLGRDVLEEPRMRIKAWDKWGYIDEIEVTIPGKVEMQGTSGPFFLLYRRGELVTQPLGMWRAMVGDFSSGETVVELPSGIPEGFDPEDRDTWPSAETVLGVSAPEVGKFKALVAVRIERSTANNPPGPGYVGGTDEGNDEDDSGLEPGDLEPEDDIEGTDGTDGSDDLDAEDELDKAQLDPADDLDSSDDVDSPKRPPPTDPPPPLTITATRGAYRIGGQVAIRQQWFINISLGTSVPAANGIYFLNVELYGQLIYTGTIVTGNSVDIEPVWLEGAIGSTHLITATAREPFTQFEAVDNEEIKLGIPAYEIYISGQTAAFNSGQPSATATVPGGGTISPSSFEWEDLNGAENIWDYYTGAWSLIENHFGDIYVTLTSAPIAHPETGGFYDVNNACSFLNYNPDRVLKIYRAEAPGDFQLLNPGGLGSLNFGVSGSEEDPIEEVTFQYIVEDGGPYVPPTP